MNNTSYDKLDSAYFLRSNVVEIARDLIGKFVVTDFDGYRTVGRIIETEAYDGRKDRACHAFQKRTRRTEVMYKAGGIAYIYLCYGIHHLFNIVTNKEGKADAILIRAIEPVVGRNIMVDRRGGIDRKHRLTAGPGIVSQALGITTEHNEMSLMGKDFFLTKGDRFTGNIVSDRRVGVDYAGEDALLPWRFFDSNSQYVSKRVQKKLFI
jgi:DNA-3-methyladenine glycosylase